MEDFLMLDPPKGWFFVQFANDFGGKDGTRKIPPRSGLRLLALLFLSGHRPSSRNRLRQRLATRRPARNRHTGLIARNAANRRRLLLIKYILRSANSPRPD